MIADAALITNALKNRERRFPTGSNRIKYHAKKSGAKSMKRI